jgi:hypothetical protein
MAVHEQGHGEATLSPLFSTSPLQSVLNRGMGDHCGHCLVCDAYSDDMAEDNAWSWVREHRCGVETLRLALG